MTMMWSICSSVAVILHGYIRGTGDMDFFTAGNSDGDYEMLQWTTTATGYPRFGLIVHHTDEVREWAYDRTSHIGKLDRGLNDAPKYNWQIVDMKAAGIRYILFNNPFDNC